MTFGSPITGLVSVHLIQEDQSDAFLPLVPGGNSARLFINALVLWTTRCCRAPCCPKISPKPVRSRSKSIFAPKDSLCCSFNVKKCHPVLRTHQCRIHTSLFGRSRDLVYNAHSRFLLVGCCSACSSCILLLVKRQSPIGSSVLRLAENKSQLELFRTDDREIQLRCKVTPNHFYDDRDLCCLSGCKLTCCCRCCFILITSSMKTTRSTRTGRVNCSRDPRKENCMCSTIYLKFYRGLSSRQNLYRFLFSSICSCS